MNRSILQIYVYDKDSAFDFYKSALNGQIGFQDYDEEGNLIHRELVVNGQAIAIGESQDIEFVEGTNMQFCLQFDSSKKDEIKMIYNNLSIDGDVITKYGELSWTDCGFELKDKYGVWWCIFS